MPHAGKTLAGRVPADVTYASFMPCEPGLIGATAHKHRKPDDEAALD